MAREVAARCMVLLKNEGDILPLKGAVLRELYPKPEYRQMGDLDYLVDSDEDIMKQMGDVLHMLGYADGEGVGLESSHDVYMKPPYMEVEIHRRLLPPTEENHWHTDDIWERLVKDKSNPYLLHMTNEDFYLFHLLHFEKHYSMGGSGIRSILDQYYLMKQYGNTMDWDYINRLLTKMNYVDFEKRGFYVRGIFDVNPVLKGLSVRGIQIHMLDDLESFIRDEDIQIAALTLPKSKAEEMTELLVKYGIKAIWNFAHIDLQVPPDVLVENVHLSESLMQLSYNITRYEKEHPRSES